MTALDGSAWEPHGGHVLASNGHIHDEMLAVIRESQTSQKRP